MKKVLKKYLSFTLAMMLLFSVAYTAGGAYADPLPDGKYNITTDMRVADDHTQQSMSAGALVDEGILDVINGEWLVTVEFDTMYLGELAGNASEIKYYESYPDTNTLVDAEVLSTRIDPAGNEQVKEVRMPYPVDAEGMYVSLKVDAMNNARVPAYMIITVGGPVTQEYTITASAGEHGTITPDDETVVTAGANQTYEITAEDGYRIKDVMVDDVSQGAIESYTFENVQADHVIVASFEQNQYTITASAGEHGTITPSGATMVSENGLQTYTIVADSGYHIKDVMVDDVSQGTIESYTFENVQADHVIIASFEQNQYTITASAGEHGTITPSGTSTVKENNTQIYLITADSGYHIVDVIVDGDSQGAINNYTFSDVQANHTIAASFEKNDGDQPIEESSYIIIASADQHGAITPSGVTTVSAGAIQIYTITPETGYHIEDVTVDGESQGAIDSYTFENIQANHAIVASFEKRQYTIMAGADEHGAITPSGTTTVAEDGSQLYTITADNGYHIKDVKVDGQSKGAIGSYLFENIQANHVITASFERNQYTITASADAHGKITPSGTATVIENSTLVYLITAESGYYIKDVKVDGQSVGDIDSYTFENVQANHVITASFERNHYTITASAEAHGVISPSGASTVTENSTQRYTIAADNNYLIKDVVVDGESKGAISSYTFNDVKTDHTIVASFVLDGFTIAATAEKHGTITPSGNQIVLEGSDQLFEIAADEGYRISSVLVDGANIGKPSSYKFENINANHSIQATFAKVLSDADDKADSIDESFSVYATIKKAYDTSEDSMAAAAINHSGTIDVIDDKWYLTVEFQSIKFMGLIGNAEDIKYYTDGLGSTLLDAEVLSTRMDKNGDEQVKEVRIPVPVDGKGVYINMYIEAMGRNADAYLTFSENEPDDTPADNTDNNNNNQQDNSPQGQANSPQPEENQNDAAQNAGAVVVEKIAKPIAANSRYKDVNPQHSYYGAVERLSEKGLLKGTGDGYFTPHAVVNRATLTTLLYRIAGQPVVANVASFDDVPTGQWYSSAVAWAKNTNIVKGYSKTAFGPQDILTKEQIMTIVYRYHKPTNKATVDLTVLDKYADSAKISSYAKEAIAWSLVNGILTLDDFGRINPQEQVTRANMAVILDKLTEWQENNR